MWCNFIFTVVCTGTLIWLCEFSVLDFSLFLPRRTWRLLLETFIWMTIDFFCHLFGYKQYYSINQTSVAGTLVVFSRIHQLNWHKNPISFTLILKHFISIQQWANHNKRSHLQIFQNNMTSHVVMLCSWFFLIFTETWIGFTMFVTSL